MGKNPKPKDDDEEIELEEDDDNETESDDDDEDGDDEAEASENGDDEKPKKKGKKTGKGSGLVPREPVIVDKAVYKAQKPEVQKLLKQREQAQAKGDKKELRKIRASLRKAGFNLSKIHAASED